VKVVELLGAPGSGKTTLARELTRSLPGAVSLEKAVRLTLGAHGEDKLARAVARVTRSEGGRIWKAVYGRSTDRFSALVRFLAANPGALATFLSAQQSRVGRDRRQDLVLGWTLNLMARYQLAVEGGGGDWLVVDEGFAQRGVALFAHGYHASERSALDAYLASVPRAEAVVALDVPLEVCADRLDHRGWSERVRDLDPAGRRRFLETANDVMKSVADHLESDGTRVIWVDGTTPVAVVVARVAATLSN
jgi:adenylate kinase family enzyme